MGTIDSSSTDLLVTLARENNLAGLLNRILFEAMRLTRADGGTIYLKKEENGQACLSFYVIHTTSLGLHLNKQAGDEVNIQSIPLYINGESNLHNVASYVAHHRKAINIPDVYRAENFDFTGTKRFDEINHYQSRSFLTVPLMDHEDEVIGVLQLINAKDNDGNSVPFHHSHEAVISALATYAAISLDNQTLIQSHKDLLDAFIQALAGVIDVRSPHTSLHCQRIPELMELMAQAAIEAEEGPFSDFKLSDEEWYELRVAAWMHDCGKLATPDYIVDKATKLHLLLDGMDSVKNRYSTLIEQTRVAYLEKMLEYPDRQPQLRDELAKVIAQFKEDLLFLEQTNKGGEFMSDADMDRVSAIAKQTFIDAHGNTQTMLSDHEVANLCISRGTLNDDERAIINRHIDVTIDILESLPFPRNLRRVPEYAGGHHEKMNGKGFPKGLSRNELSIPARMMGVADIFEALTAKERPYKPPMPLSQAFSILRNMVNDQHIDHEVYELFLRSGCWKKYAHKHLNENQKDVDDVTPYLLSDEQRQRLANVCPDKASLH